MKLIQQKSAILGIVPTMYNDVIHWIELMGRICYQSQDKITDTSSEKFVKMLFKRGHYAMLEHSWLVIRSEFKGWTPNDLTTAALLTNNSFLQMHQNDDGYLFIAGNYRAWWEAIVKSTANYDTFKALSEIVIRVFAECGLEFTAVHQNDIPERLRAYSVIFTTDRAVTHELVRHRPASYAQKSQRYCADRQHLEFIVPYMYSNLDMNDAKLSTRYLTWVDSMENAERAYHSLLGLGEKPQEARSVLPNSVMTEIGVSAPIWEWEHIFRLRCAPDAYPQIRNLMIPVKNSFLEYGWTNEDILYCTGD